MCMCVHAWPNSTVSCQTDNTPMYHTPSTNFQEQFLVPDHTVTDIDGATFSGFYYIAFQKSKGTIDGYYYHRASEWYIHCSRLS